MTFLLSLITSASSRVWAYVAGAGAVLSVLLAAYLKGRSEGKALAQQKASKEVSNVRDKWDEIDSRPTDLDGALDGLRKRWRPEE